MLTSDLLRVQRRAGSITPRYLRGEARERLEPVASELLTTVSTTLGQKRDIVDGALDAIDHRPGDRITVLGLRKLLLDRCEFAAAPGPDPAELRQQVFTLAAEARRELGAAERFDRDGVIERVAAEVELDSGALVERLFADLRANERLVEMKKLSSQALLDRYDVALAQGVLLRAIRVQIALDGEDPGKVRQLFRAARFHGLMHRVRQLDEHRYLIELDGPFSIFSAVQKYGIKLAMFLPALLRCTRWRLRADIAWGKAKTEAVFELGPDDGLVPYDRSVSGVAPALAELIEGFRKLDCAWSVEANEHIFALPGEVVCVPDLVFSNAETGEQVFLEAFGFWSRTAVWQRIETLQSGFPSRILLAVGKQLRVSEEALGDDTPGELYVYKTSMRPKEILRRLESDG